MKQLLATMVLLACLPAMASAKEIKIRGYVTNITSPNSFEVEDYKISRGANLTVEVEKDEAGGNLDFTPEMLRVGTQVEIKGDYNESTGELKASSIRFVLEEFKHIKRTALIDEVPAMEKTPAGWVGTFLADGEQIQVGPQTQVLFKLNKSQKALEKQEAKETVKENTPDEAEVATPLLSLDQTGPNTFMSYEGVRQPQGFILASRVEFMRNELEKGEANMWKSLKVNVKASNYTDQRPGELKITQIGKFKLVPNEQAQQYVRELGEKLIPEYQKNLPPGDPGKIPFQFYLVADKEPNAFATPNGIVVVHSAMFNVLENEAQLAAVMGHEISHAVQEHTWRQQQYHAKKLKALKIGAAIGSMWGGSAVTGIANMVEGAVRNGYSRSLENQADRIGLHYMLASGYDIREAPRVWKLMTKAYGDQGTNLFWSSHDNNATRRSYLMAEIRSNYAGIDFNALQKDSERYQNIAQIVKQSTAKKKK
jgi:hypothetical protein